MSTFPRPIISSDVATPEQALDVGVYIICSCMYPGRLNDVVRGLIIVSFQARYFGLCYVMCVYTPPPPQHISTNP